MSLLEEIDVLMLEKNISKKLKKLNINNLKQLSDLSKKELIKLEFEQAEIKQIEIKLQLKGLDLRR